MPTREDSGGAQSSRSPIPPLSNKEILKIMTEGGLRICEHAKRQHLSDAYGLGRALGHEAITRWYEHWVANETKIHEMSGRLAKECDTTCTPDA